MCLCAEVGDKCEACPNNEGGVNNRRCPDFRQYTAAMAAVRAAQRWIPVEEELPELNAAELVLVKLFLTLHDGRETHHVSMGHYVEMAGKGSEKRWVILHSLIEGYFHCKAWAVVAWRPVELT